MPGMVEETSRQVGSLLEIMKKEPLTLSLCLMNLLLIGFLYYQSSAFNAQRGRSIEMVIDMEKEVHKLLSECIIPPDRSNDRRNEMLPLPSQQNGKNLPG